ncbi:TBC1 domain family member 15 isoform X1 [Gadus chalcogrammus]|uniref:TBC1 domain family member 15 isoform X1 n=1 Tax=Gadus chalcogrammus TaxID=1042646 RepID=UPI0024C480D7|nr:TBC1 domain family member 15 isoform X1 [Gadus chalcogrammus]
MDPRHSDPQVPLPDVKPPQPGLQLLSPAHNEESDEPTDLSSEDTSTRAECGLTKCRGSDCSPSAPSEGSARRVLEAVSPPAPSTSPLSLPGVMDAEGRVDESRLRSHILKNGGVSPAERGLVWRFLFGMYPCSSTAAERPLLVQQMAVRYQVMKSKWRQSVPEAVRLRLNGTDAELEEAVRYHERRQALLQAQEQRGEVSDRLAFLQLQAQVLFERTTFDLNELQEAIRIIDKDVPRTDRDLDYFLGEGSGNLLVLRDILITYAAFHPEVSYAQGMNDLCSRFLEVLDSEVDTFWSFSCCMEKFSKDFRADGLHRKIELAAALLRELDPQLHDHLVTEGKESFTFCHRWLLLGFQREFEHGDALRLFEVLSCDHLELISQQVDRARHRERLAQKHSPEDTAPAPAPRAVNAAFTFELFICATILIDHRDALLRCRGDGQLIQFTTRLQGTLDLDSILRKAEEHFYNYCKRCAWDFMNGGRPPSGNKEDFFYQLRSLFF